MISDKSQLEQYFPRVAYDESVRKLLFSSPAYRLRKRRYGDGTCLRGIFSYAEMLWPPSPCFMDLEITTSCQLRCPHCARTFMGIKSQHMELQIVERLLTMLPGLVQVTLVGMGEPLLYPWLETLLILLKERRLRIGLVTNALYLEGDNLKLLASGLVDHITFSIDSLNPITASVVRPGTDTARLKKNIRQFVSLVNGIDASPSLSIFTVVHRWTVNDLSDIASFASSVKIPVMVLSDLNFSENRRQSLLASKWDLTKEKLLSQMRSIASRGIAIIGPNVLDELVPEQGWVRHIVRKPEDLLKSGHSVTRCLNPIKTMVVPVDSTVNFCNCSPDSMAGRLLESEDVYDIWHDEAFREFRKRVYFGPIPSVCKACPRR